MVALLIGIGVGLVIGLLAYRNNAERLKDIELKASAELVKDKAKARSILDALKGR